MVQLNQLGSVGEVTVLQLSVPFTSSVFTKGIQGALDSTIIHTKKNGLILNTPRHERIKRYRWEILPLIVYTDDFSYLHKT